jgi:hypothetical protein
MIDRTTSSGNAYRKLAANANQEVHLIAKAHGKDANATDPDDVLIFTS